MIGSKGFKEEHRQSERDFTRNRVLTFVGLVVSQINLMSKSLSVEVSRFVERFIEPGCDYSKQAYSKCRSKLKAGAFTALNRKLVGQFYADGDYNKWQGYLTLAVDGCSCRRARCSSGSSALPRTRARACPWHAPACSTMWRTSWW